MDNSIIYSKTAKAITELKDGARNLTREQARVLGQVDGKSSVGALSMKLDIAQKDRLIAGFKDLEKRGLIKVFSNSRGDMMFAPAVNRSSGSSDPIAFTPELPIIEATELSPEESVQAWAEARRGAQGLEEKGFYTHAHNRGRPGLKKRKENPSVLIVEDDESIAQLLELLLTNKGFATQKATDGESALNMLLNAPMPDLVLLDVVLPGKDGFQILGHIRSSPALRELPVIMVTSQISDENVMRGLKAGADGYIFKPFKWQTLYNCIQSVIGV
jgi:CheY-like chemotaxis protein